MRCWSLVVMVCAGVIACAEAEREPPQLDPHSLSVSPDVVSVAAGGKVQLSAQANDSEGHAIPGAVITFASDDGSRVEISERGMLTAHGPTGSATVVVAAGSQRRRIPVTVTPGEPAALVKQSGDQQTAPATRPLATTLAVSVTDALGNAVPGTRVRFTASEGSAEPVEALTSSLGIAETRWTLGKAAGEQSLRAEAESASRAVSTRFVAQAQAGPLARIDAAHPAAVTATVAATVRPRVRTSDEFGNPQAGISVLWDVTEGDGVLAHAVTETDVDGVAEAEWRLAPVVGVNRVVARAAGLADQDARFEAIAKPGPPARLVLHEARDHAAPALRVVDEFENPVPAVLVRFSIVAGGGTVRDEAAMTDDAGIAAVESWEPESYPAALEARIPGEVAPLRFERDAAPKK